MAIGTGDKAPEFDLEEAPGKPRVRLSDYLGCANVLLVFHPLAFTPVCTEEALVSQWGENPPERFIRHVTT